MTAGCVAINFELLGGEYEMNWVSTKADFPPDRRIVLVDGGTAMMRDGIWYSGMEEPYFQRPIIWNVTHWAYAPQLSHK